MIHMFFEIILWGYIPILLFIGIIVRKQDKKDTQFYWGYKIQEKTCLRPDISIGFLYWYISGGVILLLTVIFLILCNWQILDLNRIKDMLPLDIIEDVIAADFAAITVYSLVFALKKGFYLGISIQDVLRNTFLPDTLHYIGIDSIIIFVGTFLQNAWFKDEILLSAILDVTYLLWLCTLLYLFLNITKLLISTTKSELKSFEALKYRINGRFIIENKNLISESQVDVVCEYLLRKIQKEYVKIEGKKNEICEVQLKSVEVERNKWIKISSTVWMGGIALLFGGIGWMIQASGTSEIPKEGAIAATVIMIAVVVVGGVAHIWPRAACDRVFYVFKSKSREKIVMKNGNPVWKSRYKFVEHMQDILGLYKVLLDNDMAENIKDIIIQSVNDNIESQALKKVLLILFLYLEYEHGLKTQKGKKNKLIKYNKIIERNSLEYTLSNAILSGVYKQAKIENGSENYMKLENPIFESMVDYINRHNDSKERHK